MYIQRQVGRSSAERRLVRTVVSLAHSHAEVVLASTCHDSVTVSLCPGLFTKFCCYSIFVTQQIFCWPIGVSYTKVIARLPWIYGVKKPRPWAMPLDSVY